MARLTPPCSPAFFSKTTASSRSAGGPRVSLRHSINSFWAKLLKRSSSNRKSPKSRPPGKAKGPKHLFLRLSSKGIIFRHKKKMEHDHDDGGEEIDFGDDGGGGGGVWQKGILLGDKCQPLDFSGVIYYDGSGKQLPEFPMRSPRASPLPNYLYASPAK